MTSGAGINRNAGTAKRINRQLALYTKATAAGDSDQKPVGLVKLNNPRATRDDDRAFDGLHLNARGYRVFGKALYEIVGPIMVAEEWKIWKARLSRGLTEGATSGIRVSAAAAPGPDNITGPKSDASKKAD